MKGLLNYLEALRFQVAKRQIGVNANGEKKYLYLLAKSNDRLQFFIENGSYRLQIIRGSRAYQEYITGNRDDAIEFIDDFLFEHKVIENSQRDLTNV